MIKTEIVLYVQMWKDMYNTIKLWKVSCDFVLSTGILELFPIIHALYVGQREIYVKFGSNAPDITFYRSSWLDRVIIFIIIAFRILIENFLSTIISIFMIFFQGDYFQDYETLIVQKLLDYRIVSIIVFKAFFFASFPRVFFFFFGIV